MSPNEAQLRAALHEGEGDSVDAGALIAHAVGVRETRRRRVYMVAGAAAAVAVVGVGIAALTNMAGHDHSSAGGGSADVALKPAHPNRALPPHGAAGGAASVPRAAYEKTSTAPAAGQMTQAAQLPRPTAAKPPSAASTSCPQTAPRSLPPRVGPVGQDESGRLFTHGVAKIVVCGYPAKASESARRIVVRDGEAAAVAASLESAATTYHAATCPATQAAVPGKLELLASDANGVPSKPVVITVGCPRITATNGSAVRYPDSVPRQFLNLLRTAPVASPVK